jgi:hypothetical protein
VLFFADVQPDPHIHLLRRGQPAFLPRSTPVCCLRRKAVHGALAVIHLTNQRSSRMSPPEVVGPTAPAATPPRPSTAAGGSEPYGTAGLPTRHARHGPTNKVSPSGIALTSIGQRPKLSDQALCPRRALMRPKLYWGPVSNSGYKGDPRGADNIPAQQLAKRDTTKSFSAFSKNRCWPRHAMFHTRHRAAGHQRVTDSCTHTPCSK